MSVFAVTRLELRRLLVRPLAWVLAALTVAQLAGRFMLLLQIFLTNQIRLAAQPGARVFDVVQDRTIRVSWKTEVLAGLLEGDWSGDEAFRACRAFVEAMAGVWRRHGAALSVERLMADRGDPAFAESRIRRLRRLHLALERRIARARAAGFHPEGLDPRLASYEVVSLVESVGAGFGLLRRADHDAAILDTTAHMVVRLTTGR